MKTVALPTAPNIYRAEDQNKMRRMLETVLDRCFSRDRMVDPVVLVLTSPNGTRFQIKVSDTGVLSADSAGIHLAQRLREGVSVPPGEEV